MTALKLTAVVAAILVFAVPMALGAELSRDEYVAKVEPICEANSQANERILKGVRDKVRTGKLDAAGAQFVKAAAALKQTLAQLKAVPAPTADAAKLTKWLGYVKTEADLFAKVGAKLKADDKVAAQALVIRLTHNANLANNQVLAFDFTHCRFNPSAVN